MTLLDIIVFVLLVLYTLSLYATVCRTREENTATSFKNKLLEQRLGALERTVQELTTTLDELEDRVDKNDTEVTGFIFPNTIRKYTLRSNSHAEFISAEDATGNANGIEELA